MPKIIVSTIELPADLQVSLGGKFLLKHKSEASTPDENDYGWEEGWCVVNSLDSLSPYFSDSDPAESLFPTTTMKFDGAVHDFYSARNLIVALCPSPPA